jgi:hypothetical protein
LNFGTSSQETSLTLILEKNPPPGYGCSTALNFIRTNRALRTMLLMVTLLGWAALSQRCALSQLLTEKKTAEVQEGCCPAAPEKSPAPPSKGSDCCKTVTVVVPENSKAPAAKVCDFEPLAVVVALVALQSQSLQAGERSATGPPPDFPSFAELVLQRSLHSHAPPLHS